MIGGTLLKGLAFASMGLVSILTRAVSAARVQGASQSPSLTSLARPTRVEPIVLIDDSLREQPYMSDIMQALVSIFTGYYLQAINLMVNVGKVNALRLLDQLNPERDVNATMVANASRSILVDAYNSSSAMVSSEAYADGLPSGKKNIDSVKPADISKIVYETVNLSVGKAFNVEIASKDGKEKATIPVTVRLIATLMKRETLVHILGDGSRPNATVKERYHAWRAGQINFIRDLVLCQDLIDEHARTLANDDTNTYEKILERRRKNGLATVMTGVPSVATASNILVISKATAQQLEKNVSGRLTDEKVRARIFDSSYLMLMVVVDPDTEWVQIYHRDRGLPTTLSVRELKTANRGSGPDVSEILKAYVAGSRVNL